MRRLRSLAFIFALPLLLSGSVATSGCDSASAYGGGSSCCRVCKTGKACGDSCIATNKSCNVGPGCACNG